MFFLGLNFREFFIELEIGMKFFLYLYVLVCCLGGIEIFGLLEFLYLVFIFILWVV